MGSSTDKHQFRSTAYTVLSCGSKSNAAEVIATAVPCKCRSSLNTPSWRGFGRCAIHGYACHVTRTVLVDHSCGFRFCSTAHCASVFKKLKYLTHACNHTELAQRLAAEAFRQLPVKTKWLGCESMQKQLKYTINLGKQSELA